MSDRLKRALLAFCKSLVSEPCHHPKVISTAQASYCPDCGDRIRLVWALVYCKDCGIRRIPRIGLDNDVAPLHRYCKECGSVGFRVVKKPEILAHEIPYSISIKEIDYTEPEIAAGASAEATPSVKGFRTYTNPAAASSPFMTRPKPAYGQSSQRVEPASNVVDGEVVRTRYFR
jgi:Zn finger protein HypA/HybF involved in hydrogenase expression